MMDSLCATRPAVSLKMLWFLLLLLLVSHSPLIASDDSNANGGSKTEDESAEIFMALLVRNQAHVLANFFGYIEKLDYPKNKISVWIRTDHNEDNTTAILEEWAQNAKHLYSSIDLYASSEWLYPTYGPFDMTDERYEHVAKLRQEGLDAARSSGADYLLWMDSDNFLVNNRTIQLLIEQQKTIIAPMLVPQKEHTYSNFWCAQDDTGYYKRTADYLPTLQRQLVGCFPVPVVHTTFLVELKGEASQRLRYWPLPDGFTGPVDDLVQFAFSAKKEGVQMYILNTEEFGYIIPPHRDNTLKEAADGFLSFKLKTLVNHPPVLYSQYISRVTKPKENQGLDAVFMISLARRPDRRNRMLACLEELNFNYTLFDAVDGRQLNQTYLDELGIIYLPGWKDPWGERPMTFGEVGCFLSHYRIWEKMISEGMEHVLVLEDDVDFEPNFRSDLKLLMEEVETASPTWDLCYVGRKALHYKEEIILPGSTRLVKPKYSYWTLGYLISLRGARKLIEARPFKKLLPVDEYLPIMFNTHPEKDWAAYFPERNLDTYSAWPLLVFPTHYVGDEGWFSDTEPPLEILQKIRQKKKQEAKEKTQNELNKMDQQKKLKEQALQRQIEEMRGKLKPKTEL